MSSDAEQTSQSSGVMADRYYELAESMNQRGAMELAVPFYRQAVALLLAERESLQQQLQGGATTPALGGSADLEALHGLLEASEVLTDKPVAAEPAVQPVEPSASPASASPSVDQDQLETQIAELSDELSAKTALQVMAGLKALADLDEKQQEYLEKSYDQYVVVAKQRHGSWEGRYNFYFHSNSLQLTEQENRPRRFYFENNEETVDDDIDLF